MPSEGFELPNAGSWKEPPTLPSFIPIVDNTLNDRVSLLRLRHALGQRQLSLAPGAGVSLMGSDKAHHRLANQEGALGPRLRQAGASFVVSPGYSTWWTSSPFACVTAIARTAHTAAELARHLPVVPTIVWRRQEDLHRVAQWIHTTGLTTVAVDLGTARQAGHWRRLLRDLVELRRLYQPDLRLLVSGPSKPDRIADLIAVWPQSTLMSSAPARTANGGRLLLPDLTSVIAPDLSREDLLDINIRRFDDVVSAARGPR